MKTINKLKIATAATLASLAFATVVQAKTVENVVLWDKDGAMGITVSERQLAAGEITFNVNSRADSTSQHEMIIDRLTPEQAANPDSLPYDEASSRVKEDQIGDLGEVSELEPGQSGSVTLTLKPGTYMLFCNVAGHYQAKMYAVLHIK